MYIDDKTRLRHMIDAAGEAIGFAAGRSLEDVREGRALALLFVKCLEMVGEETKVNERDPLLPAGNPAEIERSRMSWMRFQVTPG